MVDSGAGQGSSGAGKRKRPTRQERAAFEERMDTLGEYVELLDDAQAGERDRFSDQLAAASGAAAPAGEYGRVFGRGARGLQTIGLTVVFLVMALVLAYFLFYEQGIDVTSQLLGAASGEVDRIAPPETASTPAQVLPPGVFTALCEDCGDEVTQVELDLNKDAKYQYAYESGGSRIAIFTVVDSSEYDAMKALFESAEIADDTGHDAGSPRVLEDVGDEAVVFETGAVFRTGDDCGILTGNLLQNAAGEINATLSVEELERLVRVAVPRM